MVGPAPDIVQPCAPASKAAFFTSEKPGMRGPRAGSTMTSVERPRPIISTLPSRIPAACVQDKGQDLARRQNIRKIMLGHPVASCSPLFFFLKFTEKADNQCGGPRYGRREWRELHARAFSCRNPVGVENSSVQERTSHTMQLSLSWEPMRCARETKRRNSIRSSCRPIRFSDSPFKI